MALTLKVPPPAERQLTESKWDAAEQSLREDTSLEAYTILATPSHVYTVVRETDGSLSRVRTKSQEETNVDLAPSPCASGLRHLLAGAPKDGAPAEGLRSVCEEAECLTDGINE